MLRTTRLVARFSGKALCHYVGMDIAKRINADRINDCEKSQRRQSESRFRCVINRVNCKQARMAARAPVTHAAAMWAGAGHCADSRLRGAHVRNCIVPLYVKQAPNALVS